MTRASAVESGSPSHFRRELIGPADHAVAVRSFLARAGRLERDKGESPRRIAVVGSGVAGLSAAWALSRSATVTLFEAGSHFGGHANTVDVELQGQRCGVDTGFLVYNERSYPLLIQLFDQLGVQTAASDMSFSVQLPDAGLEWSGSNLNTVFAQRANLLRPAFWGMLRDLLRFNRLCTELALQGADKALAQPIGAFLEVHGFSDEFRDWYLLPMVACIWSCPTRQMLEFPMATLIRFCHNHGLLQVSNRPQWLTVRGGSRHYVDQLLARIDDKRLDTAVTAVVRQPGGRAGVQVHTASSSEHFDAVVMATHSDQTRRLLADTSVEEDILLGAVGYQRNRAVLHTDTRLLPQRRRAWAAWNYEHGGRRPGQQQGSVCLHYLLNRLQPLPFEQPVIVSLNPTREPDPRQVLGEYDYAHPVFNQSAIEAQQRLPGIQGKRQTWFAGAWTRYGFHEDGLLSGLTAAQALSEALHLEREPA